ncbi:hypothetical protein PTKIN_Ptkin05aG0038300 [Pterospermum kingtungense]
MELNYMVPLPNCAGTFCTIGHGTQSPWPLLKASNRDRDEEFTQARVPFMNNQAQQSASIMGDSPFANKNEAWSVVVLELLSGHEALKFVIDEGNEGYKRKSVIDSVMDAVTRGSTGVRKWVDK